MSRYIMIQNNIVTNIIATDDKEESESQLNCTLMPLEDGLEYQVGWIWDGTKFIDPTIE